MCIHIEYCGKCGNEIDRVRRMADCDEPTIEFNEENGLPEDNIENQDPDTKECICQEEFRFEIDNPLECENCSEKMVVVP